MLKKKKQPQINEEFLEEYVAQSREYKKFASQGNEGYAETIYEIKNGNEMTRFKRQCVFKNETLMVCENVDTKDKVKSFGYPRYSFVTKNQEGELKLLTAKTFEEPNIDMRCTDTYLEVTNGFRTERNREEGPALNNDIYAMSKKAFELVSLFNSEISARQSEIEQ